MKNRGDESLLTLLGLWPERVLLLEGSVLGRRLAPRRPVHRGRSVVAAEGGGGGTGAAQQRRQIDLAALVDVGIPS